jgi:tRNA threonylcarbamoyladenosine biosynthesis protein TsaE
MNNETAHIHTSSSERATRDIARQLGARLQRGEVVALYGDLGAGKTQFVKGICEAFKVTEHTASPTFVLMNRYGGSDAQGQEILLYHIDLYRIKSMEEVRDVGIDEFAYSDGIAMIEWADVLGSLLPRRRIDVHFSFGTHEHERRIEIVTVEQTPTARASFSEARLR